MNVEGKVNGMECGKEFGKKKEKKKKTRKEEGRRSELTPFFVSFFQRGPIITTLRLVHTRDMPASSSLKCVCKSNTFFYCASKAKMQNMQKSSLQERSQRRLANVKGRELLVQCLNDLNQLLTGVGLQLVLACKHRSKHGQKLRNVGKDPAVLGVNQREQELEHGLVLLIVFLQRQGADKHGKDLLQWDRVGVGHDQAGHGTAGIVGDIDQFLVMEQGV